MRRLSITVAGFICQTCSKREIFPASRPHGCSITMFSNKSKSCITSFLLRTKLDFEVLYSSLFHKGIVVFVLAIQGIKAGQIKMAKVEKIRKKKLLISCMAKFHGKVKNKKD